VFINIWSDEIGEHLNLYTVEINENGNLYYDIFSVKIVTYKNSN
jgi:hypothetical protein